jgi:ATP-binding cassette, subfamily B (MDR/TAP), member 1
LGKPISFYDDNANTAGSLISRLSTDPKQLQELLGINGAFPLISTFQLFSCIIIAFAFGWKLALVTSLAALPVVFLAAVMRIRYEIQFEAMNAKVFGRSSQFATEAIGAFRTVTSLTMERYIIRKYSQLLKEQTQAAFRKSSYAMLVFAISDSIDLGAMALTFW